MAIRIVTDSTSDISAELAKKLGITVVPLTVFFGRESFLDRVNITNEFYRRLSQESIFPTTTQPPPRAPGLWQAAGGGRRYPDHCHLQLLGHVAVGHQRLGAGKRRRAGARYRLAEHRDGAGRGGRRRGQACATEGSHPGRRGAGGAGDGQPHRASLSTSTPSSTWPRAGASGGRRACSARCSM